MTPQTDTAGRVIMRKDFPTAEDVSAFLETCTAVHHSPHADILFVYPGKLEPGFTVDVGGCMAYRLSYDKTRLLAVEIHNFKAVFLHEQPQLAIIWNRSHSPWHRLFRNDRGDLILLEKVAQILERCMNGGGHGGLAPA